MGILTFAVIGVVLFGPAGQPTAVEYTTVTADSVDTQHLVGDVDATLVELTMSGAFFCRQVTDDGMDATNGTVGEIAYNLDDNLLYVCRVTGAPGTWRDL